MAYKVWVQESNPGVAGTDQWWLTPSTWLWKQGTAVAGTWTTISTEFGVTDGLLVDAYDAISSAIGISYIGFYPVGQPGAEGAAYDSMAVPIMATVSELLEYTRVVDSVEIVDPILPPAVLVPGSGLVPLQHSHAVNVVEDELRLLTIALYEDMLRSQVDEISVYGAPHLGSVELMAKFITADGLAMLNDGDLARVRFLLKAWRQLNPERGLHFLKLYLTVLWGAGNFTLDQMWQRKSGTYPNNLLSMPEIIQFGELESDFYLTSRIRVNLTLVGDVPIRIVNALRSAIAARFVLSVSTAVEGAQTLRAASVGSAVMILSATGTAS